jgi:uncharacterized membrane protein
LPGGTSGNYGIGVNSLAGYSTNLQLQCQGLPAGFSCQFQQNPVPLSPGYASGTIFTVSVPANASIGSYPFSIVVSDESITQSVAATLNVGDFTISLSPSSLSAVAGATLTFGVTVTSVNGFNQIVDLSCGNVPAGATCTFNAPTVGARNPGFTSTATLTLPANITQGTYSLTISGSSGPVTHTQTEQLVVGSLTGSISPTSATISLGSSSTFTVTVNGQNGFGAALSLSCSGPGTADLSCSFNPIQGNLPPNGIFTSTLKINVNAKPSAARRRGGLEPLRIRRTSAPGLSLIVTLAVLLAFLLKMRQVNGIPLRAAFALLLTVLVLSITSCGGGSSGGGGSGSAATSVSITVQANTEQTTQSIGTVTVTVP